jgi:quinoprotein glucose dehydrogenase
VVSQRVPPHRALYLEVPRRHRYVPFRNGLEPIPVIKPPYGTLAAYDFSEGGGLTWNLTVGDSPRVRNVPELRDLALPPLGVAGPPGPIVTAGGLVLVTGGGESLLALDARTGAQLWSGALDANSSANPMTYRTRSGRQFVVVAAGEGTRGRLVAYALPRNIPR